MPTGRRHRWPLLRFEFEEAGAGSSGGHAQQPPPTPILPPQRPRPPRSHQGRGPTCPSESHLGPDPEEASDWLRFHRPPLIGQLWMRSPWSSVHACPVSGGGNSRGASWGLQFSLWSTLPSASQPWWLVQGGAWASADLIMPAVDPMGAAGRGPGRP